MKVITVEKFKERFTGILSNQFNLQRVTYPYLTVYKQNLHHRPINFDNKFSTIIYQLNFLETNDELLKTFFLVVFEDSSVSGIIAPYQNIRRDIVTKNSDAIIETNAVLIWKIKAVAFEQDDEIFSITKKIFHSIKMANLWSKKDPLDKELPEIFNSDQPVHYPVIIRHTVNNKFWYRCQVWNENINKNFDLFTMRFIGNESIENTNFQTIQGFVIVEITVSKLAMWLANIKHISECNQSPWSDTEIMELRKRGFDPW